MCVKPFNQRSLELDNGLIPYYDTPHTSRVRQLRMRVVPIKFRQVVMSACHVSPLEYHRHEQRTLFSILAWFWWTMVNKEVSQFIRSCAHCQLVIPWYNEAQQFLQTIDSDIPFDVVFMYFWEPGDIPDQDGSRKILTCLDFMKIFRLGESIGLKEITSDQAAW